MKRILLLGIMLLAFINTYPQPVDSSTTIKTSEQKGFTNTTELNFALYYFNEPGFGIQTINGYKFNRNLSIGLGIGAFLQPSFFPVFADIRYNFSKSRVTPFLAFDLGYGFLLGSNYLTGQLEDTGGLMVTPALGLKMYISPKTAINLSIGYWIQGNKYIHYQTSDYGDKLVSVENEFDPNLSFKLGFTF